MVPLRQRERGIIGRPGLSWRHSACFVESFSANHKKRSDSARWMHFPFSVRTQLSVSVFNCVMASGVSHLRTDLRPTFSKAVIGCHFSGEAMNRLSVLAAMTIGFLSCACNAQAKGSNSLYVLANQYRVAVDAFEETVRSVRGVDRGDERLVDRLDDATAKMRLAAKNPRHLSRLFHEWRAVQKLHAEVERTIFGKYTPNHDLIQAWNVVAYNYVLFAEEYFYQIENPDHDGAVRRIPQNSARRDSYLKGPTITPLNITRLPSGAILVPPPQ